MFQTHDKIKTFALYEFSDCLMTRNSSIMSMIQYCTSKSYNLKLNGHFIFSKKILIVRN